MEAMNINSNRYMPFANLKRFWPYTRAYLYQLIEAGVIKVLKPWKNPLLIDKESVDIYLKGKNDK